MMTRNLSSGPRGLFQDSRVVKLLGFEVQAYHSCLPSLDAALSQAEQGGGGWASSAFLSHLSRQPGQMGFRRRQLRSGRGMSPGWLQSFPPEF